MRGPCGSSGAPPPAMRAYRCAWLVAAGAVLVVLAAALPVALSRRLSPNAVSGTYKLFGDQDVQATACPASLTLGSPTLRSGVNPVSLVDVLSGSISLGDTRCDSGKLEVIRTLSLFSAQFRARWDLDDKMLLINRTQNHLRLLEWSDSVGVGLESLRCGKNLQWVNTTVMLLAVSSGASSLGRRV